MNELVDVIKEALLLRDADNSTSSPEWQALAVVDALVEKYGIPKIEKERICTAAGCFGDCRGEPHRRLVFSWQEIKDA